MYIDQYQRWKLFSTTELCALSDAVDEALYATDDSDLDVLAHQIWVEHCRRDETSVGR